MRRSRGPGEDVGEVSLGEVEILRRVLQTAGPHAVVRPSDRAATDGRTRCDPGAPLVMIRRSESVQ